MAKSSAKSLDHYPSVLDVKDVQEILGIGRGTAYGLFHSGQFHTIQIGRRLKVSKEVFIRWLEGQEEGNGQS
ncbi:MULTISPECIES: helix-turn-helix domain-containing protein [unclassified Paenibacillus]|uniref:helix-turn-helix domain-containing protein n=1 Tax=unclassified Paenibacillus TaxID=185978 RepID=UPI001C11A157|nr:MULTISPECIES: helix-turn-helix domain-containing protein [unclassified Paenibacillus]MBU5440786.1 helix-turn-helix domain-containing protein [Paenibacillus sp. MSJ-34]CAH0118518.1 hypothetical protein PAE9249_01007 [Paenibacillus sp. CECT 9249]